MITVIDANAAVELALGRAKSQEIANILKESAWIAAPSLYLYEVANVLWKYYRQGLLAYKFLLERNLDCKNLVNEFIPACELHAEAFNLACQLNSSAYDASYLAACLKKNAAGLLSLDRRLVELAKMKKVKCLLTP